MSPAQAMRADARRNYEALIAVARRHLSRQGISTSLEAIAREAGVGVGTLYRHFPDRDHLIFAALNAQGEELRGVSDRLRTRDADDDRLERWLHEVQHYLGSYQGLPNSVAQALDHGDDSPLAITCQEIIEITDEFLAGAQRAGSVRTGVTGQGLFHATLMLAWLGSQLPADQRALGDVHEIFRHGYRTRQP